MTNVKEKVKKRTPKFKLNEILFSKTADEKQIIIDKILNSGISKSTLNRIRISKSDDKIDPGVFVLKTIADICNVKVDNLLNS